MEEYRTHVSSQIDEKLIGKTVKLSGFVSSIRDHGGIKFVDLRDEEGFTQLVFHDETKLEGITKESVISVEGKIEKRSEDTVNTKIISGKVELVVDKITLLSIVLYYINQIKLFKMALINYLSIFIH